MNPRCGRSPLEKSHQAFRALNGFRHDKRLNKLSSPNELLVIAPQVKEVKSEYHKCKY